MRNYIELSVIHADSPLNHNYNAIGRTPEEAQHVLDQFVTGYGATITTAELLKCYIELSKDNFYKLLWFGATNISFVTAGNHSVRVWNDGQPISGGFLIDPSEFIVFDSPRGQERRKFRLVPIKR